MAFGPGASAAQYRCQTHPEREGQGICVRCRRVVCAECSTRVDRMNFCIACLSLLERESAPKPSAVRAAAGHPVLGLLMLLAGTAALAGLFFLFGLLLAAWRPGS